MKRILLFLVIMFSLFQACAQNERFSVQLGVGDFNPVHCNSPQYCQSTPAGNYDANLTVFGYGDFHAPLDLQSVLSEDSPLTIYPNPASNQVNLVSNDILGSITVYNLLGELILRDHSTKTSHLLSTSELSPGVYFIHTQNTQNHASQIFTKM